MPYFWQRDKNARKTMEVIQQRQKSNTENVNASETQHVILANIIELKARSRYLENLLQLKNSPQCGVGAAIGEFYQTSQRAPSIHLGKVDDFARET